LFTISSADVNCPLRYTVAWTYDWTHLSTLKATTVFEWSGTTSSGTIKLANSNTNIGTDGIHYFTVSLKSYANQAISVTSAVTLTKTSPECEVATSVSSITAKSSVAYRVDNAAQTVSWSGLFVPART
jgi:hypothetical protein